MKWWSANITSRRNLSTSSTNAPSTADPNLLPQRPFLTNSNSDSFFHNKSQHSQSRFSFADPSTNASTPSTPATEHQRANDRDPGFLPPVNFDDFQTSLAEYDSNGLGSGGLLNEFPSTPGAAPRRKPVGEGRIMSRNKAIGFDAARASGQAQGQDERQGEAQPVDRSSSFSRRRASAAPNARQSNARELPQSTTTPNLSYRMRRQSAAPNAQNAGPPPDPAPPAPTNASIPPRKSVGPGVTSNVTGKNGQQAASAGPAEGNKQPTIAGTSSLSKNKRTTMQAPSAPSGSGSTEAPRVSTLTANTASRAAKVKTLHPPGQEPEPNTPNARSGTKTVANRSHTPTSGPGSSNKRQSMAPSSGRASGLGARTISPTDARRLKRMSVMQAPPVPNPSNQQQSQPLPQSSHHAVNQYQQQRPPTPQDELPPAPKSAIYSELPRVAQPSPSLIPRRTEMTPTSARASPENRHSFYGGVSLQKKSSQQSLASLSASGFNGSQSRLPTPKTRSLHSAQGRADTSSDGDESVPPVPAIPKAYESPPETEMKFFDSVAEQDQSQNDIPGLPLSSTQGAGGQGARQKRNPGVQSETSRKTSGEYARSQPASNGPAAHKNARQQQPDATATGRKNNSLQPLRLPPLNLLPLSNPAGPVQKRVSSVPKPTQELTQREEPFSSTAAGAKTPEPRRTAKTPSTPMTASKASFFRRQDNNYNQKANIRSASSHYALRDATEELPDAADARFFDTSDEDWSSGQEQKGVTIPTASSKQQREKRGITPFASGSLPKGSGEYARLRGRPSGDWDVPTDDYSLGGHQGVRLESAKPQGPRSRTTTTAVANGGLPDQHEQEVSIPPQLGGEKKEGGGSSLRRKLSLGWRRASSKAAHHAENQAQSSPQEEKEGGQFSKPQQQQRAKRYSEMPPPKLPASATWNNDMSIPSLPSSARPSLENARRKSTAAALLNANGADSTAIANEPSQPQTSPPKTTKLHSEQPVPVPATATTSTNRSTSWGNFTMPATRTQRPPQPSTSNAPRTRQPLATSPTAPTKDKDDLAADAEMQRLSQKRRDVDAAARETEELKRRAQARTPQTPEQALSDRNNHLNIFERGEITEYAETGVYFTGTKSARKIIGSLNSSGAAALKPGATASQEGNYGYDDERGDYNIVTGDHLAYRYEVVDVLGKGSFGQVVRCVDHKEGGIVAVKIIRNKKRFHQQALVEVGILSRLGGWVSLFPLRFVALSRAGS